MKIPIKKVCLTVMSVALYVVPALCLQVPVLENNYLCLGYVSMIVFCYHFSTVSGMTVGTILHCMPICFRLRKPIENFLQKTSTHA